MKYLGFGFAMLVLMSCKESSPTEGTNDSSVAGSSSNVSSSSMPNTSSIAGSSSNVLSPSVPNTSSVAGSSSNISSSSIPYSSSIANASESFIDVRDGKKYPTITVAGKTWLTANMKYSPQPDDSIAELGDGNVIISAQSVFYTAGAVSSACPQGTHVPSEDEFNQWLADAGVRGSELAPEGYGMGSNALDFDAQLGVPLFMNPSSTGSVGFGIYFWLSDSGKVMHDFQAEDAVDGYAYPVRCVKDVE